MGGSSSPGKPMRLRISSLGSFSIPNPARAAATIEHLNGLSSRDLGALELREMDLPEGCMRPMTDGEYALVQAMLPPSRMCPERQPSSAYGVDCAGRPWVNIPSPNACAVEEVSAS
mgnify:CR=1 FL=1